MIASFSVAARAAMRAAFPAAVLLAASRLVAAPGASLAAKPASTQSASVLSAPASAPQSNSKFGTVGKAIGFSWYRYYNREWDYLERPANPNRLYTLGKLEPRREPGLDWCLDAGPACFRGDPASQRAIYEAIFEYEKSRIERIVRHHAAWSKQPAAIRFVIGNEPNFYP